LVLDWVLGITLKVCGELQEVIVKMNLPRDKFGESGLDSFSLHGDQWRDLVNTMINHMVS
jgi:hypothetical protein